MDWLERFVEFADCFLFIATSGAAPEMATPAQTKSGVADVQGNLGCSHADTSVNVYMHRMGNSVKRTQNAIYRELAGFRI